MPNTPPTTYQAMVGSAQQQQQRATTNGTGYVPTVGNSKQKADYLVKPQSGETFPTTKPARPQPASHTLGGPGGHATTSSLAGGQAADTNTIQPPPHRLFGADLDQAWPGLLLIRSRDQKQPLAHRIVGVDFARSAQVVSKAHFQRMMDCGCRDCALFLSGLQAGKEAMRQGLVEGVEKAAKGQATQQRPTRRSMRPGQDPAYRAFDAAQRLSDYPAYLQRHTLVQGIVENRFGTATQERRTAEQTRRDQAARAAAVRVAGDEAVRGLAQQPGEQVVNYIARCRQVRGRAEAEALARLQRR